MFKLNDRLKAIVAHHVCKGWEKCRYDDMIIGDHTFPDGIVDAVGISVPSDRRLEVAWYAAQRLRSLFTERHAAWKLRLSSDEAMQFLIDEACSEVIEKLRFPPPVVLPIERRTGNILENGFSEWLPFRARMAPRSLGVYLLAQFDDGCPTSVEPLNSCVIDIGMSASRKVSIAGRLDGFQLVALTGRAPPFLGKSSGWTYRVNFVREYEQLVNFKGLYVSWIRMDDRSKPEIARAERDYLNAYCAMHNMRPAINRR